MPESSTKNRSDGGSGDGTARLSGSGRFVGHDENNHTRVGSRRTGDERNHVPIVRKRSGFCVELLRRARLAEDGVIVAGCRPPGPAAR